MHIDAGDSRIQRWQYYLYIYGGSILNEGTISNKINMRNTKYRQMKDNLSL